MTAMLLTSEAEPANPIDLVEQIVAAMDWPFERLGDDDINVCASGSWCDYNLAFSMAARRDVLTISAAFDFRVTKIRRAELCQLLVQINERLFVGHFDLIWDDAIILYRHGLPLAGGAQANPEQCEQMLRAAVDACERFYPAFQFVLWGGKTAAEAIEAAILECHGEA